MRSLFETSMIHSVEDFLLQEELFIIRSEITSALAGQISKYDVRNRNRSVHELPDLSREEVVKVYEPNGRIELDEVPDIVREIVSNAVQRRLPDICRAFPSVTYSQDWFYVEYGPSQYITPHVDYPIDDDCPERSKYAVISVILWQCQKGGGFFVETCGNPGLWKGDSVLEGANFHSEWFRSLRRTRWETHPQEGDALCWGTQVIHGTLPVAEGKQGKLLGFLY